jgi:hypothetical protein
MGQLYSERQTEMYSTIYPTYLTPLSSSPLRYDIHKFTDAHTVTSKNCLVNAETA